MGAVVSVCRVLGIGEASPVFHWEMVGSMFLQVGGAVLGLWNRGVRNCDRRAVALVTPLAYLLVVVVAPKGAVFGLGGVVTWCGVGLVLASFVVLGRRFSVGAANWAGLVAEGPYRWVRHPQAVGVCLQVWGVAWCHPEGWWRAGVVWLLAGLWTAVEESYLMGFGEWREYAARVGKFIPGVGVVDRRDSGSAG